MSMTADDLKRLDQAIHEIDLAAQRAADRGDGKEVNRLRRIIDLLSPLALAAEATE